MDYCNHGNPIEEESGIPYVVDENGDGVEICELCALEQAGRDLVAEGANLSQVAEFVRYQKLKIKEAQNGKD